MGEVYILDKNNFNSFAELNNDIIIKKVLSKTEAKDFLVIQNIVQKEISEDIKRLKEDSLTKVNEFRAEDLVFCLALDKSKFVAYGYGNKDFENKILFYINTIAVHPEYRNQNLGTRIKIRIIPETLKKEEFQYIKAITQDSNLITKYINCKLGFKKASES